MTGSFHPVSETDFIKTETKRGTRVALFANVRATSLKRACHRGFFAASFGLAYAIFTRGTYFDRQCNGSGERH